MRQRPGLKVTVISLPCLKDLVSSQGFNVGIQSNMNSLPCIKDLASRPGFDVGLLYESYKSFSHQRSGFKPGF